MTQHVIHPLVKLRGLRARGMRVGPQCLSKHFEKPVISQRRHGTASDRCCPNLCFTEPRAAQPPAPLSNSRRSPRRASEWLRPLATPRIHFGLPAGRFKRAPLRLWLERVR
ncbi:hypothetical protein SKAU_G00048040 [Synaphobranchus kaupii]|uniref:Uncharacterized protein n=1 Tax=Synaphobranchus kaupii TaxID=118154 RepID=A0A9Q1G2H3_SYNKA|nr:hypothetical protein SKAU_G00048040 [Synaphobranchus kaupii]